jgi:hypothetical protein
MSCSRTGPVPESPGPVMLVVKCGVDELYPLVPEGIDSGGAPTRLGVELGGLLLAAVLGYTVDELGYTGEVLAAIAGGGFELYVCCAGAGGVTEYDGPLK